MSEAQRYRDLTRHNSAPRRPQRKMRGGSKDMDKVMTILEAARQGMHDAAVMLQENLRAQEDADFSGGEGPTASGAEKASAYADEFWSEVATLVEGMRHDADQLERLIP